MKTLAFPFTGAAAFALSACGGSNDQAAADDSAGTEAEAPVATATETTVVRDADSTDSAAPDRVTVSPDGVKVDVDSNGTAVKVDTTDKDPAVSVSH